MRAIVAVFILSFVACDSGEDDRPSRSFADGGAAPGAEDGGVDAPADARPPFDAAAPPIACAVTPCMTRLVAGPTHYCAVASDGAVWCWGNPTALGDFATSASGDPGATPVVLAGVGDVAEIGASAHRTCIAHASGGVDCFGLDLPKPTPVAGVTNAKKLAIGDARSCAVEASGALFCWGDSPSTGTGDAPAALGDETAVDAVMSPDVAFAIGSKGTLYSWGAEPTMLGRDSSLAVDLTPGAVIGMTSTLAVAASDRHACALTADGRLFCWGHGDDGVLGLGSIRTVSIPTEVLFPGPAWPAQIAVAVTHSCVRMTDGTLACWARANTHGELGRADLTGVYIPTAIPLGGPIAAVAVGTGSTCVLTTEGAVRCWGDNAYGQLGLGQRDGQRHPSPTKVVFP